MSLRIAPLAAILLLSGCAEYQSLFGREPNPIGLVQYICSEDYPLTATFHQDPRRVVVQLDSRTVELEQIPAASGVLYRGGGVTFWDRGKEAMLERAPGVTTRVCRPDVPEPAPSS